MYQILKKPKLREFPGCPAVVCGAFTARDQRSIPGWESKIVQATRYEMCVSAGKVLLKKKKAKDNTT